MAFEKSTPTNYGVPAVYWNIGAISEDFKGKGAEVTLYGYTSKEARNAKDAQPLVAAKVTLTGDEYSMDMTREKAYAVVKKQAAFEGATDA